MKYLSAALSLVFFFLLNVQVQAQHNHANHSHGTETTSSSPVRGMTDIFIVYGNCGMCEGRIERTLIKVKGVNSADWNVDTKVMTVIYDDELITLDDIKKRIVAAGHDTDKYRAEEEVYNSLPGCCQYDRPEKK